MYCAIWTSPIKGRETAHEARYGVGGRVDRSDSHREGERPYGYSKVAECAPANEEKRELEASSSEEKRGLYTSCRYCRFPSFIFIQRTEEEKGSKDRQYPALMVT